MKRALASFLAFAALWFATAAQAITVTHVGNHSLGSAATTAVATTTANVPSGALIIVVADVGKTPSASLAVTDQVGNTYHLVNNCFSDGLTTVNSIAMFYAFNATALPSGDTVTVTFGSSSFGGLDVSYATGMNTTSAVLDVASCNSGSSAANGAQTSGVVTPTFPGDLVIGFSYNDNGSVTTQGGGFSTPPNVIYAGADVAGNKTNTGTAQPSYAPSNSAAGPWATILAMFEPAAGAATAQTSLTLVGAGSSGSSSAGGVNCGAVPIPACTVGYSTETFSTTVFNTSTVDMSATYNAGFQWYPVNYSGQTASQTNLTLPGDGSIQVYSNSATCCGNLATVGLTGGGSSWHGTAFGGGFYVDAVLKFNDAVVNTADGWPAWWSAPLEHIISSAGQDWPGQTQPYFAWLENDIMEYEYTTTAGQPNIMTLHTWYGATGNTNFQNVLTAPWVASWSSYNHYSELWVPATVSTNGYYNYYIDGVQVGTQTYSHFTSANTPPPAFTWAFGVGDSQHQVLLLDAGTNSAALIQVQSVTVWQASSANNLTQ